ncbi:MAG: hypothetical protein KC503_27915 [Myxococcales bacterium]|nr:hypothetical protein [Myxococcales bacterium]
MTHRPTIALRVGDHTLSVLHGTPIGDVFRDQLELDQPPMAAILHQRCVGLHTPVCADGQAAPVSYSHRNGVLVYRRTATMMLREAVRRCFGKRVRVTIGQALGNGYFYAIHTPEMFTAEQLADVEREMRSIVDEDLPLSVEEVTYEEARDFFEAYGDDNKLRLLRHAWARTLKIVRLGETWDIYHMAVAPSTSHVSRFELVYDERRPHEPAGLILRFPPRGVDRPIEPYADSPKLVQTYLETADWLKILGVETAGQLNELTARGDAHELIRINEGLHEKKIAQIADQICSANDNGKIRLVCIAGPSSSGKTTLSKRLSLQLRVNGVRPVALSTDNFYVDRVATPLDEDGNYDFEAIEAIDLPFFNEVLAALLRGEEVHTPRFDFHTGTRKPRDKWPTMRLEEEQVLVVEGIHGLNPRLTESVPEEQKFRIYISALTQLCVDDHNRIFTSDARFIRRIVRDRLFRGYSAAQTIDTWPRVRRGEQRNIFPYQEEADVMFNSALIYEQAVLRLYAERFLLEVPHEHPSYVDAYRLLRFIENFVPAYDERIPETSILREFIGGSYFKY